MAPTSPIGRLFGRNPFTPLQEHMRVVVRCVDEVPELFEALARQDRAAVEAAKERIFELEREADAIRRDLRIHLPNRLFLPVNRRDLLEVLDMQDEMANVAQDIAGLLVERPMIVPEAMAQPLRRFVAACVAAGHQAASIIEELDELLETGFEGREANHVEDMITELNIAETGTDEMGLELTRLLFEHEDEMKPVSVVFWYQIIEWIGDLADYGEKAGNQLRLLIAR